MQQILEPSSEIHPKFQTVQFLLDRGEVIAGLVVKENKDSYHVAKNLLTPHDLTRIDKRTIEEQLVSKVSAMPAGLINTLTKSEILDMLRFLELVRR